MGPVDTLKLRLAVVGGSALLASLLVARYSPAPAMITFPAAISAAGFVGLAGKGWIVDAAKKALPVIAKRELEKLGGAGTVDTLRKLLGEE